MEAKLNPLDTKAMDRSLPFNISSSDSIEIRASKMAVNTCFKWKEKKTDASGNVYDPNKVVQTLSMSLGILTMHKIISLDQSEAIIKQLMST